MATWQPPSVIQSRVIYLLSASAAAPSRLAFSDSIPVIIIPLRSEKLINFPPNPDSARDYTYFLLLIYFWDDPFYFYLLASLLCLFVFPLRPNERTRQNCKLLPPLVAFCQTTWSVGRISISESAVGKGRKMAGVHFSAQDIWTCQARLISFYLSALLFSKIVTCHVWRRVMLT